LESSRYSLLILERKFFAVTEY